MTSEVLSSEEGLSIEWRNNLSKQGKTFGLDFMIGNRQFLGKGLGSPTLRAFMMFYATTIDPAADTFLIDPEESNTRAKHVYEKAGFQCVTKFERDFNGKDAVNHFLMVKKMS